VSRPGSERPPTPEEQRDPKYWLGQLWGVWRKILLFAFVGLGAVLLLRFGPGAALILVPIGLLIFGSAIFAGVRIWMRGKR
jgi:uncharacterized membrane protein